MLHYSHSRYQLICRSNCTETSPLPHYRMVDDADRPVTPLQVYTRQKRPKPDTQLSQLWIEAIGCSQQRTETNIPIF